MNATAQIARNAAPVATVAASAPFITEARYEYSNVRPCRARLVHGLRIITDVTAFLNEVGADFLADRSIEGHREISEQYFRAARISERLFVRTAGVLAGATMPSGYAALNAAGAFPYPGEGDAAGASCYALNILAFHLLNIAVAKAEGRRVDIGRDGRLASAIVEILR